MKVTNRQLIAAFKALQEIDRTDDKQKPLYKLGNAKIRLAIAKKLRRLADENNDLEKARVALARELNFIGDGKDENDIKIKFTDKWAEVITAIVDIEIGKLSIADLNLDTNEIPVWVLADLDWLLEE